MHDVDRHAGHLGQGNGSARRFSLGPRRPRERVVLGCGLPLPQRLLHQRVDHAAVLRVHADEPAVVACLQQRSEDRGVVHHEDARVGHEQLERRDPLVLDHLVHLARDLVRQLPHDHVEGVVDDGLAFRPLHPALVGGVQALAEVLDREVDEGGASVGRRDRAGLEIIGRLRSAERHVEMRVDVDPAGHDELARGVDHRVRGQVQPLADQADDALVDVHVGLVAVGGRDDGAVLDESGHGASGHALDGR